MRAEEVLAEASDTTGLDDFGPDDFREGLGVLCDSLTTEARLNDFGHIAVRANVVGALANRLRVLGHAKAHPEVAQERIEAPLVVIGMFRAGTTLLSHLLDQDPANRALLGWEAADPVPPPTPGNHRSGPRLDAVRAGQQLLSQINPAIDAVHHEDAGQATECLSILGQDFKSLLWEAVANVPSYGAWLDGADHRSAYEHHWRTLQVLQSGGVRGRWTLKSPHHAIALDALAATYPDAQLVLLHRDPRSLVASVCSLITTLSGTFTDADHRAYIARRWTDVLAQSIERIEAFRSANPTFPIVDVLYDDLVSDPVATVAAIYSGTGRSLTDDAAAAMAAHVRANPKGKHGAHHYDLADFGLHDGKVMERFAAYADRYGVAAARG